jgi:hypothetical protein
MLRVYLHNLCMRKLFHKKMTFCMGYVQRQNSMLKHGFARDILSFLHRALKISLYRET